MSVKLKPLDQQVIVITGASSGIGLATAETAARKGAKVVLAARSGETLEEVAARITAEGGQALSVPCDVSDRAQVNRLAQEAIAHFGRIDTWVNDAGIAIYGRLDEVSEEDSRKLFETNFWGVVHGSLAALPHLKRRWRGTHQPGQRGFGGRHPAPGHVHSLETCGQGLHRLSSGRDRGCGQGTGVDHLDPADGG